jgi:hypothetical protein
VASGARLDTRALGRHTFTVLARDRLGQAGRSSVTYTVIPDPAIADVRQSAKVWRAHGLRRRGRPPVGTRFAFTVNERVNVVLAFSRVRCTAPHNGKPGRRSCRRTAVGTISLTARPGGNRVRFRGRVNGKLLEPGAYAVVITASAGGRSVRRRLTFTVAA